MKITDALDQLLRALTSEGAHERDAASAPTRPASWRERDDAGRAVSATGAESATQAKASLAASDGRDTSAPAGGELGVSGRIGRFTPPRTPTSSSGERALPDWIQRSRVSADSGAGVTNGAESNVPGSESSLAERLLSNAEPDLVAAAVPPVEKVEPAAGVAESGPTTLEDSPPAPGQQAVAASSPAGPQPPGDVFVAASAEHEQLSSEAREAAFEDAVGPTETELSVAERDEAEQLDALVPSGLDLVRLEATAGVVESLNLGFHLGSAVERIAAAAGQGSDGVPELHRAAWLIERYIALLERRPIGADLHLSAARLARTGDTITDLKTLASALNAVPGDVGTPGEQAPGAAPAD
jgi:hypothetical protein